MIRGIIFDMDGVLVDAQDWHYDALNRALRLFGYEISRYNHLTTYNGLSTKKKLEMLSLESNLPRELHTFINEMKQNFTMEIIHAKCKPRFIHQYALATLKSMHYKLALASNSIRPTVDIMMQKVELMQYFDGVLSASDVLHPKPDPEIYLKTMAMLELHPTECLIIEDNENGIKSAQASFAHVMKVNSVLDVTYDNITKLIQQLDARDKEQVA